MVFARLNAQDQTDPLANYLEDQLYFSLQNNSLIKTPDDFKSYGFSNGISFGFIKDIPLNEQRNSGLGVGLGLSFNSFKNNIKLIETNGLVNLIINDEGFDTNKISTNAIEIPIEYRWRTSTPDKFKFWRIYSGIKVSYVYKITYSFVDSSTSYQLKNPDVLNNWQYGLTLNAGYSAFNLYTYFGLSPLYKEFNINNEKSLVKELKLGLIFYIL